MTTAKELFLAGIEATEAERIARGALVETEDLRQMVGLPPRRATSPPVLARPDVPRPVTSPVALAEGGREGVTAPSTARTAPDGGGTPLDAAIERLASQGLSSRAIADQLYFDGYDVSHMTVARHLRKAKR
jgi:hypothetical protein